MLVGGSRKGWKPAERRESLLKIKDKEIILEAAREKKRVTYKGVPIRLLADFTKETSEARRNWQEVFKNDEKQGPTT